MNSSNKESLIPTIEYHNNLNVKKIIYHKKTEEGMEKVKEEDFYENGQKKTEISQNRHIAWYEDGRVMYDKRI